MYRKVLRVLQLLFDCGGGGPCYTSQHCLIRDSLCLDKYVVLLDVKSDISL